MNTPFEPLPNGSTRIVYVRPIAVADLPEDVQAEIAAAQDGAAQEDAATAVVYSVNAPDGQRLALVADRMLAFHLARAHDFAPVNVH